MTTGTASQIEAGESSAGVVRLGEVVAEKYVVEKTLGVGGMGVVVAARDRVLERKVAIKFLLPRLAGSETAVQRFIREARAATRVTSEHVVRLLEIDKLPSGTPFFVMEYLEGRDLRALLRDQGPLSPSVAVDYVLQALQAVAEGHTKGIVHRDIKPGNLFLATRADGTPLIKVLDFGIAKTAESDGTDAGALTNSDDVRLGSPAYMPPEQLQDPRDVDTRSDIWSLGATLYELLCGRPPFEGPGYLELASRILSAPPRPMSEQNPPAAMPRGLEQVIARCLEKERSLRYANAAELAAALAPFGSEDARVSLTRVTGVLGASQPTRSGAHRVLSDSGDCATTLTVRELPDARSNADKRSTESLGPSVPSRERTWWVAGGAGLLVLGLLLLTKASDDGEPAVPTPPNAPAVARLPQVASPRPAADAAVAAAPSSPSSPPAGKPSHTAPPLTGPASTTTGLGRGRGFAKLPPAAASTPSATPPEPSLPTLEQETPAEGGAGLGRSAEIERLIEQRR